MLRNFRKKCYSGNIPFVYLGKEEMHKYKTMMQDARRTKHDCIRLFWLISQMSQNITAKEVNTQLHNLG